MDLDPNAMFQGRKCILNYLNSTKYILYYIYDMYRILKHHFCYSKFRMISLYEAKMNIEFDLIPFTMKGGGLKCIRKRVKKSIFDSNTSFEIAVMNMIEMIL